MSGKRPPKQCVGCDYMEHDDYYYQWLCQRQDNGDSCSRHPSNQRVIKDKYISKGGKTNGKEKR